MGEHFVYNMMLNVFRKKKNINIYNIYKTLL